MDLCAAMKVMYHRSTETHLDHSVATFVVAVNKLSDQIIEALVLQRFVHQFMSSAKPQSPIATASMNCKYNMAEVEVSLP